MASAPHPHMLLHSLFHSGLVKHLFGSLREVSQLCQGTPGAKLAASRGRQHAAIAATWVAGALSQAMSTKFVKITLTQACTHDLETRRMSAVTPTATDGGAVGADAGNVSALRSARRSQKEDTASAAGSPLHRVQHEGQEDEPPRALVSLLLHALAAFLPSSHCHNHTRPHSHTLTLPLSLPRYRTSDCTRRLTMADMHAPNPHRQPWMCGC